jgi:hypothetical protein
LAGSGPAQRSKAVLVVHQDPVEVGELLVRRRDGRQPQTLARVVEVA